MLELAGSAARAGFTLVEVVMVIVMAGLLMGIAVPRFTALRSSIQLDTAAQQLAGDLRRLQVEAIKRNRSLRMARTGASAYTVDSIGPRTVDGTVQFGGTSADSIRMRSFGPPATGAATFTLTSNGLTKSIIVNAAGRISVQ